MFLIIVFIVFLGSSIYDLKGYSLVYAPWNQLVLDSNYDDSITISDITEFASTVFFLPADSLLFFIFDVTWWVRFFEVEATYDHGFWAGLFSSIIWLEIAFWIVALLVDFVDSLRSRNV
jgi:hypothetical protein